MSWEGMTLKQLQKLEREGHFKIKSVSPAGVKLSAELTAAPPAAKKQKYGARRTVIDGIRFDSRKEADYYCELKLRKKAGLIRDFQLQPRFVLQPGFVSKAGKRTRPIIYIGDFLITASDGHSYVVDVKSSATMNNKVYRLKKKLLMKCYPDLDFREYI